MQLFEPRYIDMLTRCLKEDRGFVVVLLQEGGETGRTAAFYDIGTYVRIIDFQQLDNGLLGITVEGESKVSVVRSWQQEDGLNVGDVECLLEEAESEVPARYSEPVSYTHLVELQDPLERLSRLQELLEALEEG